MDTGERPLSQTIDSAPRTLLVGLFLVLPLFSACSSAGAAGGRTAGATHAEASPDDHFVGRWDMGTTMGGREISAVLTLERGDGGSLQGVWVSQGQEMELLEIHEDGATIAFEREMGGSGQRLHFEGTADGDALNGAWSGGFGELASAGTRSDGAASRDESDRVAGQHDRPMLRENGRTLLWADGGEVTGESETDWFDLTDSTIDPERFQHGVGRDSIASIDEPVFVSPDDALLLERGVSAETPVLGVFAEGVARAYPVDVMDMHEIVNDTIGDKSYAVLW